MAKSEKAQHEKIDEKLSAVLTDLNNSDEIPCRKHKGASCAQKAHALPIKNGKTQFWYGLDCELPRREFCGPCLAHFLVSVARNLILFDARAYRDDAQKAG